MLSESLSSAFHTMWDLFPEPVMLIDRDLEILASNARGRELGIPVGCPCYRTNPEAGDHPCGGCRAREAMDGRRALAAPFVMNGQPLTGYWIPVQGAEDVFIHFGLLGAQPGCEAGGPGRG